MKLLLRNKRINVIVTFGNDVIVDLQEFLKDWNKTNEMMDEVIDVTGKHSLLSFTSKVYFHYKLFSQPLLQLCLSHCCIKFWN